MESPNSHTVEFRHEPKAAHDGLRAAAHPADTGNLAEDKLAAERLSAFSLKGLKAIRAASISGDVTPALPFFALDDPLMHPASADQIIDQEKNSVGTIAVSSAGRELMSLADKTILQPGYPNTRAEHATFVQDVRLFEEGARKNKLA